jgi:hypothetical protein
MLQPGDMVPHFTVTTLDGQTVAYSTIWQRRNLLLVSLPAFEPAEPSTSYVGSLTARMPAFIAQGARCVFTREAVAGVPCPGVVVADRWGEIFHVAGGPGVMSLPTPHEIIEWLDYVQRQCPECQGETK